MKRAGLAEASFAVPALLLVLAGCSADRMEVITLASESLRMGMLAHWPCDEEGGGRLADVSGNGHDGTLMGPVWGAGRFGGGLHFELGNWVNVQEFPQATSSWSVALWYRAQAGDFAEPLTLASNEQPLGGGWTLEALLAAGAGRYRFGCSTETAGGFGRVETDRVDVESWAHVAAVVDADAWELSLFKNGALVGVATMSSPIKAGVPYLLFGRSVDNRRFLAGDVDDIVVFNRALVEAEVQALYARPAPNPR